MDNDNRMEKAIEAAMKVLGDAPDINPNSYNHDQSSQLNDAANEAYHILDLALAAYRIATEGDSGGNESLSTTTPMLPEGWSLRNDFGTYEMTSPYGEVMRAPVEIESVYQSNTERFLSSLFGALATVQPIPVAPTVPDVDALAEFIRDIDDGEYIPFHEFAQHICNWIEEQQK